MDRQCTLDISVIMTRTNHNAETSIINMGMIDTRFSEHVISVFGDPIRYATTLRLVRNA